ncbi:hypothetical protein T4B_15324 [Trichinella pseudospiralis]|uniref:Uncharacterized protein n=1 Tax=Trichinella pseudospiralis TaxID=6337 RepID=A0A0V1JVT2_TRIPS|nr:hypothetical protein T4B_15324 [Trichinella pseudospiralis]KRZ39090.1 hypothetical protein T4C_4099 [Trichinella pseudospiralis]
MSVVQKLGNFREKALSLKVDVMDIDRSETKRELQCDYTSRPTVVPLQKGVPDCYCAVYDESYGTQHSPLVTPGNPSSLLFYIMVFEGSPSFALDNGL